MKNNEEIVNINFFKKVWYSITKFEKYPEMATEGLGKAVKYLIILSAFVTVFMAIGSTLSIRNMVFQLSDYINNNIPEFSYENGEIQVNPIYQFVEDENSTLDRVSGHLIRTDNPFMNTGKLRLAGINEVI